MTISDFVIASASCVLVSPVRLDPDLPLEKNARSVDSFACCGAYASAQCLEFRSADAPLPQTAIRRRHDPNRRIIGSVLTRRVTSLDKRPKRQFPLYRQNP
jgi:hypothetical protein